MLNPESSPSWLQTWFTLDSSNLSGPDSGLDQSLLTFDAASDERNTMQDSDVVPELIASDNLRSTTDGYGLRTPKTPVCENRNTPSNQMSDLMLDTVLKDDVMIDPTETEFRDLAELNIRIYRLLRTLNSRREDKLSSHAPSQEEMIDLTRSLLEILDRVVARTKGPSRTNQDSPTLDDLSLDLEDRLRGRLIDPSSYMGEMYSPAGCALDTGTGLMLLSCHQRLLDLFKYVCLSLHPQMSHSSADRAWRSVGSSTRDYEDGQWENARSSYTVPSDNREKRSSNAKVVMTVELILHLLSKMERGQRNLLDAWNAESMPFSRASPSSSLDTTASQTSAMPRGAHPASTLQRLTTMPRGGSPASSSTSTDLDKPYDGGADSANRTSRMVDRGARNSWASRRNRTTGSAYAQVAQLALSAMAQKQAGLYVHAKMIKRLIKEVDEI
ncbi:hypothetical protein DL767_000996 [Monosporascus sp. MG133]|nr:hypothetical protein DL767_000996 [Monosporascus sp. MG133]